MTTAFQSRAHKNHIDRSIIISLAALEDMFEDEVVDHIIDPEEMRRAFEAQDQMMAICGEMMDPPTAEALEGSGVGYWADEPLDCPRCARLHNRAVGAALIQ